MFRQGLHPHNLCRVFHNTQDMERACIPPEGDLTERPNPVYESKGMAHSVFHTEGNAAIVTWYTGLKTLR